MINLLPSEHKSRFHASAKLIKIIVIYAISLVMIFALLAGLFTINMINKSNVAKKQTRLDSLTSQVKQAGAIVTKAALIEDRVNVSAQYQEQEQWDNVLKLVSDMTPTGVQLSSLKIAQDTTGKATTVTLGGTSPDRRSAILYKDKLATQTNFVAPVIQSLSAGASDNPRFTFGITLTYKGAAK